MKTHTQKIITYSTLIITISVFFGFGLFHLAQFETTDEHLWKYDRIPQYWHAIASRAWTDTYINDKPGITVALISGIGLLTEPHPEDQYLKNNTSNPLFEQYNTQKTLSTNFAFRLPVLIFATLSLFIFFYLIRNAFEERTALLVTIFIATNPILLGMSQIINPDSFFWIFGGLALFSYIALLHTSQKKFLILCAIFTGFAFLSKYTAFTLFIFYIIYACGYALFMKNSDRSYTKLITTEIKNLSIILIFSITIFALILPAVIADPTLMFKGLSQFITKQNALISTGALFIIVSLFVIRRQIIDDIFNFLRKYDRPILITFTSLFTIVILFNLINAWTDQKMIPADDLRDAVYANEPQSFNFKPFLTEDSKIEKKFKVFFVEAYPLIFSLTPIVLFAILTAFFWSYKKSIPKKIALLSFSVASFSIAYFLLTILARVITNVRYSIILYPILSLLAAATLIEICNHFKIRIRTQYLFLIFISFFGMILLWQMRPFYFSYTNFLLPQKFSIHDSWGHGSYEAAQYLNALPNADQLIIWSNSDTVCRFFHGKCLRSRKIDLLQLTPDYFVISKRGEIKERNHFILLNNPNTSKTGEYYFQNMHKNALWMLFINDRPDNYIKIIPYEKN